MENCVVLARSSRCIICYRRYLSGGRETVDLARCGSCVHAFHAHRLREGALGVDGPTCPKCEKFFEETIPLLGHRELTRAEVSEARAAVEHTAEYEALTSIGAELMYAYQVALRRLYAEHEKESSARMLAAVDAANAAVQADLAVERDWEAAVLSGNAHGRELHSLIRLTHQKKECEGVGR